MTSSSKIFVRNKALGYVSNHIPLYTRYIKRRKEHIFITCVGKSFHTYGSHLALLSVSHLHPEDITCINGDANLTYTAAGNIIYAWRKGRQLLHEYNGHEYPVKLLLPFGPHLISIDEGNYLKLWNIRNEEVVLDLEFKTETFDVTALMHPDTYLNKILLGSEQGTLQLWNLNTSKLIYTFKGWGSGVNIIQQSPAVDVVGIGLKNGHIILHNLKFDETVMEFHQDWGIVTALTFRLDNSPIMISGTTSGHLILWNLEERKVFSQLLNAHDGMVAGLKCLPNEKFMASSSPDNSLKLWAFDMPDGGPRLLTVREGHSLPPTFIRFHGAVGCNLLSAGGDSCLRIFNTKNERYNKSLGKTSYNRKVSKKKKKRGVADKLKMPPIVKFTSETTREKEWDSIAAIHLGIPEVTTWSYDKVKMGDLKLIHDRFIWGKGTGNKYKASPCSIHLTHCGNFVIMGYTSGHCDRYNIQSGFFRTSYGKDTAHKGSVRGVTTDNLNLFVITGGSDCLIKWWNFKETLSKNVISTLELEDGVSFFITHNESSLTAVALENFSIIVIDNEGRNVVRKFLGHSGRVTDATFSPDSRWLITAGMDCCIYTWDIPSGCLIDQFKVDAACTSLSFSPTGEILATTHVEYLGVFLWYNRTLFNHVTLKPIPLQSIENIPTLSLPSVDRDTGEVQEEDSDTEQESTEQIDGLITLSNLARSRWQNLLSIDIIKKRNKPKEPPQVSVAPFFLPTVPSLDITFDLSAAKQDENTRIISSKEWNTLTGFGSLLKKTEETNDYRGVFEKLKCMGPSMIDLEISSLATGDFQLTHLLLSQFMKMIKFGLESKLDFELAQAYLGLFLKVHGETIIENESLLHQLEELKSSQNSGWEQLENNLLYSLSVIQSLKLGC